LPKSSLDKLINFSSSTTLFGIKFVHSVAALYVFDQLFDNFAFDQVLEFGTLEGGLTAFLWLECRIRGKRFLTVDQVDQRRFYDSPFYLGDLLEDFRTYNDLCDYISQARTFLYCDNGDKFREIKRFAPALINGSILGTHDIGVEVTLKQLKFLRGLNFRPIKLLNKISFELKTHQFFWRKFGV